MNNKIATIEVNNHIYTMDDKNVYVQPYSERYDVYCDPILIGIATNGFEFNSIVQHDAKSRRDEFKVERVKVNRRRR